MKHVGVLVKCRRYSLIEGFGRSGGLLFKVLDRGIWGKTRLPEGCRPGSSNVIPFWARHEYPEPKPGKNPRRDDIGSSRYGVCGNPNVGPTVGPDLVSLDGVQARSSLR